MNPLSLLMNPWVLLGLLLALAGAGATGWHYGAQHNEAAWQKREAQITAESAAKIEASMQRALTAERKSATDLAAVSAEFQKQLQEVDREKDRVIAGVRAGNIKLSIPARCAGGGSNVPAAGAPASGRDGETRAELSAAAADFLVAEASRADAVVQQLAACQAVVARDRQ